MWSCVWRSKVVVFLPPPRGCPRGRKDNSSPFGLAGAVGVESWSRTVGELTVKQQKGGRVGKGKGQLSTLSRPLSCSSWPYRMPRWSLACIVIFRSSYHGSRSEASFKSRCAACGLINIVDEMHACHLCGPGFLHSRQATPELMTRL